MAALFCSIVWLFQNFVVPLQQIKVQTLLMPPRLVRSGVTGSSELFNSMLSGQDVGESARGAARWAAPLH